MATAVRQIDRIDVSKQLSPVEKAALNHIRECIDRGQPVTQMGITVAIGSNNTTGGTAAGVLARLERDGHITRYYYQRGLQVCDPVTGKCSPEPASRATHWRNRTDRVPTVPLHAVRTRNLPAAQVMEAEARRCGMDLQSFQMQLIVNGLELWLENQEEAE